MGVPGTLSTVVLPSNTTTTTITTTTITDAAEFVSAQLLTEGSRVKSDVVARPQLLTHPALGSETDFVAHVQPDPVSQLDRQQDPHPLLSSKLQRYRRVQKTREQKEERWRERCQNINHDESSEDALNDASLGRLSPKVRSRSEHSNTDSQQEATSAVPSKYWLLGRENVAQNNLEVNSRAAGSKMVEDSIGSPRRHLRAPSFTQMERMDEGAVIAIDMLREWGEKGKDELFPRHPRLEACTTGKLPTSLSAALTGLSVATSIGEGHPKVVTALDLPPNSPLHGRNYGNKAQVLECHASLNETGPPLDLRGMGPRHDPLQVGNVPVSLPRHGSQHSLEAISVAKMAELLEDEDILSRGFRGRSHQTMDELAKVCPRRKGERMDRRAVRMSGAVPECRLLGAEDVFEVLRNEPGGEGGDGALLSTSKFYSGLSRSAINRVVALEDRSMRRRAGDVDSKELMVTTGDMYASTVGSEEQTHVMSRAPQLPVGIQQYHSAEDELCSVMELCKMAATCTESVEFSTPSSLTEVIT
ncbi:hypothetical protein TraAM80_02747 [Trypanosoma rangeli]|uniref:Uncharacterized protein n=1 Tax=Trypanosoma rangeli TaxID=5698 RepID=A0A422NSI4_TRYRA|nr:uncharacterized protein TraAM80_02747 [Trypanosoma rangeli]RNF08445.1 hypothetical protein TraAM80_02747 [Trypanosoma rangeli]|eukprot:RNF08445.1 hypothetical protein TraAM80_02747 [Trypanosoma rangeli]